MDWFHPSPFIHPSIKIVLLLILRVRLFVDFFGNASGAFEAGNDGSCRRQCILFAGDQSWQDECNWHIVTLGKASSERTKHSRHSEHVRFVQSNSSRSASKSVLSSINVIPGISCCHTAPLQLPPWCYVIVVIHVSVERHKQKCHSVTIYSLCTSCVEFGSLISAGDAVF